MGDDLARISISRFRQKLTGVLLAGGGFLVLYVNVQSPSEGLAARILIPLFGLGMIWLAIRLVRAGSAVLVLQSDGIWTGGGEQLCALDDIEAVRRSMLEMKPTNGFALVLRNPARPRWQPGLYWALGKRIGIGGSTNPLETKHMAQSIEAILAERTTIA